MCSPVLAIGAAGGLFSMLAGQSSRRQQKRLAEQQLAMQHRNKLIARTHQENESTEALHRTATAYSSQLGDLATARKKSGGKSLKQEIDAFRSHQEAPIEGGRSRSAGRNKSLEYFNKVQKAEQLQMDDSTFARGAYLAKAQYQNKQAQALNIVKPIGQVQPKILQPQSSRFEDFLSGWTGTMTASKQLALGFSPIV